MIESELSDWNLEWTKSVQKDEKEKLCELCPDGVTVRASDNIRLHVVRLVLGSIPSSDLYERHTFEKYKNYSNRHN